MNNENEEIKVPKTVKLLNRSMSNQESSNFVNNYSTILALLLAGIGYKIYTVL